MEHFTRENFPEVGELGMKVYYVLGEMKKKGIPTEKLKGMQISSMEEWKVGWS